MAGNHFGTSGSHHHRGSHPLLSLRGTSGERAGGRGGFHRIGATNWKNGSSPRALLLFWEEREKRSAAALQANYLPNSIGVPPSVEPGILPGGTGSRIPQSPG